MKALFFIFVALMLITSTVRGNEGTDKLHRPDGIKNVVFADLYLDGGTTVLFGETSANKIFYLHASGSVGDKDVLLWDRKNLIQEVDLLIVLLNELKLWSIEILEGNDPVDIFRLHTSGEIKNQMAANAVLVFGFIEEVCASRKLAPVSYSIINSKVCKDSESKSVEKN